MAPAHIEEITAAMFISQYWGCLSINRARRAVHVVSNAYRPAGRGIFTGPTLARAGELLVVKNFLTKKPIIAHTAQLTFLLWDYRNTRYRDGRDSHWQY